MAALRPSQVPRGFLPLVALATALLAFAFAFAAPAPAQAATSAVFTVSGRGWGHGIGMTQYGAMGYADQGRAYDWILAHYFQQTSLAKREELTVKVDLDASKLARSSWHIAAASSSATLTVTDLMDSAHRVQVKRGASAWITFSGGRTVLRSDRYDPVAKKHVAGSVVATFTGSVVAGTGASIRSSTARILGKSGPFAQYDIAWRGQIRFTPNTTTGHAIDYVPMEQYLRGVVPRESPSSWPAEALRAQAVAARSYAYDDAVSGGVLWCTTMSQVYNGADDGIASHESSKTDAAVAATANEFVVYGAKVVKTYFSSSSGGRTANSKDVWFGDAGDDVSPVYYTSVADADNVGSNPNYRWTPYDMSGASLADKIRDHDNGTTNTDPLGYSVASPATVTGVSLDRGASGFVRYVTLKWSTGKSFTIKGPTFQSALRLRSSAFTVTLKTPPPPVPKRFQQSDTRIGWSGPFKTYRGSALSGGSHKRTDHAGSLVTVMFKGASIAWIGAKAPTFGRADVSLDGTRVATVDLYSTKSAYKRTLWSVAGLSADTTHTVTIRVLGTHRTGAKGSQVSVDAFDVVGALVQAPLPPVYVRSEQTLSAVRFAGIWTLKRESRLSGGSYRFSHSTAASVAFTFVGTRVKVIGKQGPSFGRAWISIDGGKRVSVDLYASTVRYRRTLWTSALLRPGTHTVRVSPAGTRSARATGHYVGVDAYDVLVPAH